MQNTVPTFMRTQYTTILVRSCSVIWNACKRNLIIINIYNNVPTYFTYDIDFSWLGDADND